MTSNETNIKHVLFLSEVACREIVPNQSMAVISITEPGRTAELQEGWGAILRTQFCDAEYDNEMIARLKKRGKRFDPVAKGFPSKQTSLAIIGFLDSLQQIPNITTLIVHCRAGQRRSAGVAKFAAERFSIAFDHSYDNHNKTVYQLLHNPDAFTTVNAMDKLKERLQSLVANITHPRF